MAQKYMKKIHHIITCMGQVTHTDFLSATGDWQLVIAYCRLLLVVDTFRDFYSKPWTGGSTDWWPGRSLLKMMVNENA